MRNSVTAVIMLCSLLIVHPGTGTAAAGPKRHVTGFRTLQWGYSVEKLGAGAKKPAESYRGYERRNENLMVFGSKAKSISYFFNNETGGLEKVEIAYDYAAKNCNRLKNAIQGEYGATTGREDLGPEQWFFWETEEGSVHLTCNHESLEHVDAIEIEEDESLSKIRVAKHRKNRMKERGEYISFCDRVAPSGSCEHAERYLTELPPQQADKREYYNACSGEPSGILIFRMDGNDIELGKADINIGGGMYITYTGRVQDGIMSGTATLLMETMDGNIEKSTETWSWRAVQKKGFPSDEDCREKRQDRDK